MYDVCGCLVVSCHLMIQDTGMDANKDEADRSKSLGRTALQNGEYDRAIRLLRLSDRLAPSPDTRQLCKYYCLE